MAMIGVAAEKAYREANYRNGKKLKKHVSYTLPQWVADLIDAMDRDDEEKAKAIMT